MSYLSIKYSNSSNNIGNLIFQDSWEGRVFIDTDLTTLKPEYETSVAVDANKVEYVQSATLKKYYSFSFGAKNTFVEALSLIPLCDVITITARSGIVYNAKDVTFEPTKKDGSYYNCTITFYSEINISRGENKLDEASSK